MSDEKIEVHPSAGAVGAIGATGDLGSNAAGAERAASAAPAVPAATSGFQLAPAFAATTPEAQLVQALVNAGFPADEAGALAQRAIAEIESRKASALAGAADKGK